MIKWCRCGLERTGGYPVYCERCRTFTHTAYFLQSNDPTRHTPQSPSDDERDAAARRLITKHQRTLRTLGE